MMKTNQEVPINYAGYTRNWQDPYLFHMDSLLSLGSSRQLTIEDLGLLPEESRTRYMLDLIEKNWQDELKLPKDKRSLVRTLRRSVGSWGYAFGYFLHGINAASVFAGPMMLNKLLLHLSGESILPESTLWIFLFLLLFAPIIGMLSKEYGNLLILRSGMKMRGALISFILRKACNLSTEGRGTNSGTIDNIFANDTEQLALIPMFAAPSVYAPAQLAIGLALVYQQLGASTFFCIAFLFATLPVIGICGAGFGYFIKLKLAVADTRIKLTKEIMSGVRIIKYFAWEKPFGEKIKSIRSLEIKYIIYIFACWVMLTTVVESVPVIQPVIIFYAYSMLGNSLTYSKAFTSLSLFTLLTGPISALPGFFQQYFNATVACDRILKVLNFDDREVYVTNAESKFAINLEEASFGWVLQDKPSTDVVVDSNIEKKESQYEMVQVSEVDVSPTVDEKSNRGIYTLQNLSFSVEKGSLIAVVGSVGSGKSSLIQALLGEMYKSSGSININGTFAFHGQQPWVLNRSLRDNITIGKKLDEKRLNDVLAAVALDVDIRTLPAGLDTEIGEKGINLSGGQKARVSLARCLYSDSDIYLLDDPLAAVDASTADHLFHVAIRTFLKGKTILLVTHQVQFLNNCDKVLVMSKEGTISAFCKDDELSKHGIELNHLSDLQADVEETGDDDQDENLEEDSEEPDVKRRSRTFSSDDQQRNSEVRKRTQSGLKKGNTGADEDHDGTKLIEEEENKVGLVESAVYSYFIRTGGTLVFSAVMLCIVCQKAITQVAIFWLAYWGSQNVSGNLSVSQNIEYLTTYAWLNTVGVAIVMIRTVLASLHAVQGGLVFHNNMLDRVLGAPQSFFDTTPVGRILNRFTGDIQQSDQGLTALLVIAISLFSDCISGVIAIAIATSGYFLVIVSPLVFAFYKMQHFYRITNIQIRRIWNVSKSPIFTELTASLQSIVSLRSYNIVDENIARLETRLDDFLAVSYMRFKIGCWLNIRLETFGAICSFFVAVFTVASADYGAALVSPGSMAVALIYSFSIPSLLSFTMALLGEIEGMMSSIERIKDYSENVQQEELDTHKSKYIAVPNDWPSSGKIVMKNVEMRYRDGPLVLNKVSFEINDKEKVGIVGRTGSGKSTLLTSLFRFENLYSGEIFIDNIDISQIPLSILRKRLCIIPQEPILFCATLRFNLDPFDEHTDLRLWEVIETVGLKEMVQAFPNQLQFEITEGGDNLSVGQRQLLCFGRALLRNPKIVFLDEATAAVDNVNDALLQNMIRTKFADATTLTIAHRLHTIIDSDRVIMLSNGVVSENGNPSVLIRNGGMFAELWAQYEQAHKK